MKHSRTRPRPRIVTGTRISLAVLGALALLAVPRLSIGVRMAADTGRLIYVATTGSDSNAGTAAAPYLTINHAAQVAQPGDTVLIHAGLYRETVKPARGGTDEAHRITYTNAGDGEVVIKGSEEINS